MSSNKSFGASLAAGLDEIHDSWGWFVVVGILLMVLGLPGSGTELATHPPADWDPDIYAEVFAR